MNKKQPVRCMWAVITVVAFVTLACGIFASAAPTAMPTQPPLKLPTLIPTYTADPPTNAPEPTAENTSTPEPTAEVAATEQTSPGDMEVFMGLDYLPYHNGQLFNLDDFSKLKPGTKVFDFTRTGKQSQDFALSADIELDSRGSTTYPKYAGCGFAYRVQNNSEGYTAMLTNNAVRMGSCYGGLSQCQLFGTTHGTGIVDVRNQTKTNFSLAVNRDRAYAFVDGIQVGEYSLFTTKLLGMGDLYYGVVSDINSGYWTSCKITNVQLWESLP